MKILTSLICVSLLLVLTGCNCHPKHGHHDHGMGKMHHEHGDK